MSKNARKTTRTEITPAIAGYDSFVLDVVELLESARRAAARTVNAVITATYWEIGRRIIEFEQAGAERAAYGSRIIERLSGDLTKQFGRGFGVVNLTQMRKFYQLWPEPRILQTASEESTLRLIEREKGQTLSGQSQGTGPPETVETVSAKTQTLSGKSCPDAPAPLVRSANAQSARWFHLPWSHDVRLLAVKSEAGRKFYEAEALRGGWTVRQLDRQINTQFYERTALSRNKAAMLHKGEQARPEDAVTPEEEIKDPFVLEFLGLKGEYSESDLEEALIRQLESFLLELGGDFTFVGRQRRLRIGDEWYRIDLLFYDGSSESGS